MAFGIPPALFDGAISSSLGILFLIVEFREMSQALDSEDWPVVDGEVEATGVTTDPSMGSVTYAPLVRYHYRYGDREYVSDRIFFGGVVSTNLRTWAARIAKRYGQQKTVRVHVSPQDPMTAVLEPGVHWFCWVFLVLGAVFVGLGLVGLLSYCGLMTTSIQFK